MFNIEFLYKPQILLFEGLFFMVFLLPSYIFNYII